MKFLLNFFFSNNDDDLNIGLKKYKQKANEIAKPQEDKEFKDPGFLTFSKNSF